MSDDAARGWPRPRDVCAPRSSPRSKWVCGYAELGKCCASGPSAKGHCGLLVSDGSETAEADAEERMACMPRRSFEWRRQSLCLNLAILTGGLLLLCMTLPSREKAFVPGELSSKHAQILDNTLVSQRCGLCHPGSHLGESITGGMAGLTGQDWGSGGSRKIPSVTANEPVGTLQFFAGDDGRQDALCMQCHKEHMPGGLGRTPHDLSTDALRALTAGAGGPAWQQVGNRLADPHHSELAKTHCADCHIEHHGRSFDLKAIADDRCQACHRRKFESFANGHPDFKNFPPQQPRALAFSHQAHADKHFPQKNRNFECRACHVGSGSSTSADPVARSVSFEVACAECHQAPIRAAGAGGWAVLQLPSIDAMAAGEGSQLEHWPDGARFGFEGTISPVLRALLEADPAAEAALASLPESGELNDIPALGGLREQVTKSLAVASERLIRETAHDGQAAWRERITKVTRARTGRELNAQETALVDAMCAGLPPDLFRRMTAAWFDRGVSLTERSATNEASPAAGAEQQQAAITSATSAPKLEPLQIAIHRSQHSRNQGIVVERKRGGLLVSDSLIDDELLSDDDSLTSDADGDSLLDDALLDQPDRPDEGVDLLGGAPVAELSDPAAELSALATPDGENAGAKAAALPFSGDSHLAGGGWYIDDQTLALRYMPTGHADPTLAAWNLWWGMFPNAPGQGKQPAEQALSAPAHTASKSIPEQIPGNCIQCHELRSFGRASRGEQVSLAAAWRVPVKPTGEKAFTKFDHAPHLSLPAVNDCRYCHVLRDQSPGVEPPQSSAGGHQRLVSVLKDAHVAQAAQGGCEFREMHLAQCVACHRPNGASASCLQCHNYHVSTAQHSAARQ